MQASIHGVKAAAYNIPAHLATPDLDSPGWITVMDKGGNYIAIHLHNAEQALALLKAATDAHNAMQEAGVTEQGEADRTARIIANLKAEVTQ